MGEREEAAADRVLAAYQTIEQWWAQDFKRSRVPANLTYTQFAILGMAQHREGVSVSYLAERLGLSNPTVVRAVDALERKALVQRQRSEADARMVAIAATPEGTRIRELLERMRRDRLAHLLAAMPAPEVDSLVLGFQGMARAAAGDLAGRDRVGSAAR